MIPWPRLPYRRARNWTLACVLSERDNFRRGFETFSRVSGVRPTISSFVVLFTPCLRCLCRECVKLYTQHWVTFSLCFKRDDHMALCVYYVKYWALWRKIRWQQFLRKELGDSASSVTHFNMHNLHITQLEIWNLHATRSLWYISSKCRC